MMWTSTHVHVVHVVGIVDVVCVQYVCHKRIKDHNKKVLANWLLVLSIVFVVIIIVVVVIAHLFNFILIFDQLFRGFDCFM